MGKERIGEIENPELGMGRMQKLYENERPIMQGAFGVNVDAYKKGTALERKNLRNHMTDLELILTMLDAATTAYFKQLTAKRPKKLKARED